MDMPSAMPICIYGCACHQPPRTALGYDVWLSELPTCQVCLGGERPSFDIGRCLYSYGLYSYGLYSYAPCSYGHPSISVDAARRLLVRRTFLQYNYVGMALIVVMACSTKALM